MRKGALGVENLNRVLQRYLNPEAPDKPEIPFGHGSSEKESPENGKGVLRLGDKVMQIRNNYQLEWEVRNRFGIAVDRGLGVFNGDMGSSGLSMPLRKKLLWNLTRAVWSPTPLNSSTSWSWPMRSRYTNPREANTRRWSFRCCRGRAL